MRKKKEPPGENQEEKIQELRKEVRQLGLLVALILEIMATWTEADGMSLLTSQQLHSPSSQRDENVRVLLQRIRELGETSLFKWGA